jgi:hypothetical protein
MRKLTLIASLLAAVAVVVVGAVGATAKSKGKTKTFTATLTGKAEAPGPGDPDGRGSAVIKFRGSKVCYDIKVRRINGAAAAHIHKGKKGEAGPVVVSLLGAATTKKRFRDCVTVPNIAEVLADVRKGPRGFYVNVHNADYPDGAIRGQLKKR